MKNKRGEKPPAARQPLIFFKLKWVWGQKTTSAVSCTWCISWVNDVETDTM